MSALPPIASVHAPVAATAFESRWGWHACDRATFLALKEYHRYLLRDLRATRRHERWIAKDPKNRVQRHWSSGQPGEGVRTVTPIPEPRYVGTDRETYAWVLNEYQKTRRPQPTAELVKPLDLPTGWRERLSALVGFWDAGEGQRG